MTAVSARRLHVFPSRLQCSVRVVLDAALRATALTASICPGRIVAIKSGLNAAGIAVGIPSKNIFIRNVTTHGR
jgi:ABC-type arginine/histidine transport system permease subunit